MSALGRVKSLALLFEQVKSEYEFLDGKLRICIHEDMVVIQKHDYDERVFSILRLEASEAKFVLESLKKILE